MSHLRGAVVERRRKRGKVYALRFRAYGKRRYVTLGPEVTTREQAEEELLNVIADVRRGMWRPVERAPVRREEPREEPTFHEFASEWVAAREAEGLAAKTLVDLRWSLERHLLPYFADFRLGEITAQDVDRYKVAKVRERAAIEAERAAALKRGERFSERGLANGSINHTLRHLAQILETAVEYGLIGSNAATGKRRRLKATRPARPWVEPEQLMALLDETSGVGRVLLGLLAGTGLRIGEALALRWGDVDLGTGTLHVRASKTEKGVRRVDLSPALREELTLWKADAAHVADDDLVIHTATGRRHYPSNLRRDVLFPAIERANVKLAKVEIAPLGQITFHSFRRTYATLQRLCGEQSDYVADQLGHEDSRFTDRVYRQTPRSRRDRLAPAHRKAFDRAVEWALMGASEPVTMPAFAAEETKSPV